MKDGIKKALLKVLAELYRAITEILIGLVIYLICRKL